MKIRNGFVSNSSSSSFIVGLPCIPESAKDLQSMLFHDTETAYRSPYSDRCWPTDMVAADIYDMITRTERKNLSNTEVVEEITGGYFDGCPDTVSIKSNGKAIAIKKKALDDGYKSVLDSPYGDEYLDAMDEDWKEISNAVNQAATSFWARERDKFSDMVVYVLEISDESEYGSDLEHGDLFRRVPHIRVSHH